MNQRATVALPTWIKGATTTGLTSIIVVAAHTGEWKRYEDVYSPPVAPPPPPKPFVPLAARNDRCPCGSGKKYKRCCRRP